MGEQFKAGQTSVMLATSNSVRGLDFADLTHVYSLYLPVNDPREYLHMAGRVGRIGHMGSVTGTGGRVTSILCPEEEGKLTELADLLDFSFIKMGYSIADVDKSNVDEMRRYLEDTMTLLEPANDLEIETLPNATSED